MAKKKTVKISTLGSQITSIISVALVLLILGVLATIGIAAGRITSSVLGDVSIIIKIDNAATNEEVEIIKHYVQKAPYSSKCIYTSADDVMKQEMEYNADVLDLLGENPYSAELEVKLQPQYVHSDSITYISGQLMLLSGIEEVVSQTEMVRSVNEATNKLSWILSIVAIVMLIISLVLIFNTVSIAVYGRRFIIRTMQLVGATSGFIRRPFVMAGIVSGVIAALIASGLLIAGVAYMSSIGTEMALALPAEDMAVVCGGMLVLGVTICGLASFFATNKYLYASQSTLYS